MSKLDDAAMDQLIYPTYYIGYIDPEDFCDKMQYHMGAEGVQMSDATYEQVWADVERHNKQNHKKMLTEEDKYIARAKRNIIEASNV